MTSLLDLDSLTIKATDPARYSVQSRADNAPYAPSSDVTGGGVFWITMGQMLDEEPPWNAIYPNWRDRYLRNFTRTEPMIASAIYSMKTRVGTLNYALNGPPRAKKFSQALLNDPGLGDSLSVIVQKLSDDLDSSDNGAFLELWRPGNPLSDAGDRPVLGFAHLDSRQCWRSFDPEFPVWYTNPITSEIRKIHRSRIVMASDNPQPVELARGIGFCSTSRALRMTRIVRNMQTYVDEKISGRFTRAIGAISGITTKQLKSALRETQDDADNKGYVIYKGIPIFAQPGDDASKDIKLMLEDLASIPDGFVFKDDVELYAYILAFCFGVDAREFWPATQSGATKADASVQNMKARGRGIGNRIQTIEGMLRVALPEAVTFEYDYSDDDQDKMQADIRQVKTIYLSTLTKDGAINAQEERALAIAEGVIDGKLLEGLDLPVTSDTGTETPPAIEADNVPVQPDAQNATDSAQMARKSQDAYRSALRSLVRGYWKGDLGQFDFVDGMSHAIERNFTEAWFAGAITFDILPTELTDEELTRLRIEIDTETTYILPFAQDIAANSRANDGALQPLLNRVDLWVNNYGRVESLAGIMAAADRKAEWEYGDTIDHCPDCLMYQGRVYRNSVWLKNLDPYDAMPRGKGLNCGGWNCDCRFVPTDKPITLGRPPKPMGRKSADTLFDTFIERLPIYDPA